MKNILRYFLMITLFASCGGNDNKEAPAEEAIDERIIALTDQQISNAGITTGKIENRQVSSILRVNGRIDVPPQNTVSVSVPLGGYLKTTRLLPGMTVKKGEVLAVIEDQQYIQLQQDYLTARARISFLENEYNRQKDLNVDKASSDKVFQQAEAEFRTQKVLITALREKLLLAGIDANSINENFIQRSINIYSPINGFVSKVNVNIGQYISPTQIMFELVNPADIHLALTVFEKDLDKLYVGQKLVAYTNNNPDKKYPCEVLLIGRDLSDQRNTEVHCHFMKYDKSLVPGTYMNAEIEVANNKVAVLPSAAVVRYEGKHYVYRARENKQFEMLPVSIGESENGYTQIEFAAVDQSNDDSYVTKGAYSLLMMMKNKSE
jgi:membrane fusion protein, heavy metal efflux system